MCMYNWQLRSYGSETYYYYEETTGKICGKASKLALQENWFAVVYVNEYTYLAADDEKHLGQYLDANYAKKAIEHFWDVQSRTLLAEN
jgi:hypothetical protein